MTMPTHSFSHLESPASGAQIPQGQHIVRGWVWPHKGGHIVDVRARIGDRIFPGVHGIPRADLALHFKTGRQHALAEFYIVVDLSIGSPEVVLENLGIDGRWVPFIHATYEVQATDIPSVVPTLPTPLRWHEYGRALQMLLRDQRAQPQQSLEALATSLPIQLRR